MSKHPMIVQGGMGVGVSSPRLARAVASRGQLGVVSGTAVAATMARRLAAGDPDGEVRRALAQFPAPDVVERILDRYLDSTREQGSFGSLPQPSLEPPRILVDLTVAGAFVEVWLAKQGHQGLVGINLLEKVQLPTLPTLYGALLAGVDYVFMGAGIPTRIPAVLDRLATNEATTLPISVAEADRGADHVSCFDPADVLNVHDMRPLRRPQFIAIVASTVLAKHLMAVPTGPPDGFVIEAPTAGGHNAPPRGRLRLSSDGEPVYGPRDEVALTDIAMLDRPFWIAGGAATPAALRNARSQGAAGVQVGTAFAFCEESGLSPALRQQALQAVSDGQAEVRTDPTASPTGFPFKMVPIADTIGDEQAYEARPRKCDLGYLRQPYQRPDGNVGYRCPAEPVEDYVAKGGDRAAADGRRCLCNGLVAAIGLGQRQPGGYREPALLTAGDDLLALDRFLPPGQTTYTADDVIDHILGAPVRSQRVQS